MGAGHEVRLFTGACDFPELPWSQVWSPGAISTDPFFQTADLVYLDFGIFYGQFSALLLAPASARVVVRFHNITPKELLPRWDHAVIDRSLMQLSLLRFVDEVHCDSEFNLEELRRRGVGTSALVRGLPVETQLAPPIAKPSFDDSCLRIAFVGRFVRSKGPLEVIEAVEGALSDIVHDSVEVTMVGNIAFSDSEYVASILHAARRIQHESAGRVTVRVLGSAPDVERNEALRRADLFVLPTYHEGFCVPILEALASGCDVISYDNSNVAAVSAGLATLVTTSDIEALAGAISARAAVVGSIDWRSHGYAAHAAACADYVESFSPERRRSEFLADIQSVA